MDTLTGPLSRTAAGRLQLATALRCGGRGRHAALRRALQACLHTAPLPPTARARKPPLLLACLPHRVCNTSELAGPANLDLMATTLRDSWWGLIQRSYTTGEARAQHSHFGRRAETGMFRHASMPWQSLQSTLMARHA